MYPENDSEFREGTLVRVRSVGDGYAELDFGNGCGCMQIGPEKLERLGFTPEKGHSFRIYGRGFGSPVRGVFVEGKEAYYYSPEAYEKKWQADADEANQKKLAEYDENKEKYQARIEKLPAEFQARITSFRRNNPDFNHKLLPYELMCCEQAFGLAVKLETREGIKKFHDASWEEQKKIFPDLDEGHSGNSFAFSCRLAIIYLENPELVDKEHGAMCPLTGCKDYGCYSTEKNEEAVDLEP